jgi:negative regulator of sigma E activity
MNEELDSQLSAMFDDELPPAECELLARRLSRDEQLKARWGRYAIIGASIRAEQRGGMLQPRIAPRVSEALRAEPVLGMPVAPPRRRVAAGAWWQPLASVAVAAGVATAAILWMRSEGSSEIAPPTVLAPAPAAQTPPVVPYTVPRPGPRREVVPSTSFANYMVAHFEVSSPVARQAMISDVLVGDRGTGSAQNGSQEAVPVDDMKDDATTVEE